MSISVKACLVTPQQRVSFPVALMLEDNLTLGTTSLRNLRLVSVSDFIRLEYGSIASGRSLMQAPDHNIRFMFLKELKEKIIQMS